MVSELTMYKTVVLILAIPNLAFCTEPPQWVVEYAKVSRQYRYDDLVWARSRYRKSREHRELIKRLENPFEPHYCPLHGEPNRIGVLSPEWYNPAFFGIHVQQVVDSDTLIGTLNVMSEWPKGAIAIEFPTYWIDGIPTDGVVDDSPLKIPRGLVFLDKGSKTYPTAIGGSKTVYKAQVYPLAKAKQFAGLFCVGGEVRAWKDKSGATLAEGSLVGYRRGETTIRSLDGKETQIELKKLSDDGAEFVRSTLRWESTEAKKRRAK